MDHLSKGDLLFHLGEIAQRVIFMGEGRTIYVQEEFAPRISPKYRWLFDGIPKPAGMTAFITQVPW